MAEALLTEARAKALSALLGAADARSFRLNLLRRT